MPYASITDLPEAVQQRYSERCQEVFRAAANKAMADSGPGGAQSEESAFKIAHTAAGMCRGAGKAWTSLKAQDMGKKQLDQWLSGEIPRRILVVPFGGPLPGGKAGVDLDGEYFDEVSDLYGPADLFPMLHASRERMVDWHHDEYGLPPTVPVAGRMKGAILGRVVFDDEPEEDGLWAEWWANAGERRMALIKSLSRRDVPLYGSTEAVPWAVRKATDGHLDVWPVIRHTISTSPQNTYAVVPPLKALLTESAIDGSSLGALQAAIAGLLDAPELIEIVALSGLPAASEAIKAGRVLSAENESALNEAIAQLSAVLAKIKRPASANTGDTNA